MRKLGIILSLMTLLFQAACAKDDYTRLYKTEPKAPSLDEDEIAHLDHMGPTLVDRGVNFAVYSEAATRMELLLFDDPESNKPTQQFQMSRFGDVWNLYVEGVGIGQHYGYAAWGPNWEFDDQWFCGSIHGFKADVDAQGNRFNPNKLLMDPYSKAIHRDHDWSRASQASGPARTECTWGAGSKSVVVVSEYEWSSNEATWREMRKDPLAQGHAWNDLILYEVHPKGFTANPASGVEHYGTFRGIAEKADYLSDLGITAVELMPVHEKPQDGGYWGYWTTNFFSPENTYTYATLPNERLDEFKEMVDTLHQHNIEVVLDVVYNHTGEGGLWRNRMFRDDVVLDPATNDSMIQFEPKEIASISSYRGLDNSAFYALSEDNQIYWNNTGVGNETRPNYRPTRRLIIDSLRYYATEMHVDGFRFDLAGILGEQDQNYNYWDDPANTVLQDIIDDPVLQEYNTRIIAEPWTAGGYYGALIGAYPSSSNRPDMGWGEWNGRFRDWWKAFVNYDDWKLNSLEGDSDGGFTLTGSSTYYQWNGRHPYHSVNYVAAHDGFTMYDHFSYNEKINGCGPLNPVCCSNPSSAWCEIDNGESNNRSRDWGQDNESIKRELMRDLYVAMIVAQGTPMLMGGDEWMRTQYGNNNAYSSGADNEWNWFRWGEWQASDERHRMHDFVRNITRLRKEHLYAFAPMDYGASAPFAWKNPANQDMQPADWGGKRVMMHYYDTTVGPQILILINMDRTAADFTLPAGAGWVRLVDTQEYFDQPEYFDTNGLDPRTSANVDLDDPDPIATSVYNVAGSSIVILEAK